MAVATEQGHRKRKQGSENDLKPVAEASSQSEVVDNSKACNRCQNADVQPCPEGMAASCKLGHLPGAVIAGEIMAKTFAQSCKDFETKEPTDPCECGDYVRGQLLKDGSWIEGEVTALGRKYVQLDGEKDKAVLIESVEVLRPAIPEPPHGLEHSSGFLTQAEADRLFKVSDSLDWQHNNFRLYGKEMPLPRLEIMFGDAGCSYRYGNVVLEPQPWIPELQALRERVEAATGCKYQIVIGNLYRDGKDHIGWHSDDSPEMGVDPAIASVSLGATRRFDIRNNETRETEEFYLKHGDLVFMPAGFQGSHKHRITKSTRVHGVRINWTFRPHVAGAQTAVVSESKLDTEQVLEAHEDKVVSDFKAGDRVRVTKGYAKGLISYITKIEPDLKHSCTLHVGGRQTPDCLEKLEDESAIAPTNPSSLTALAADIGQLWADVEQANEVIQQATYSEFETAKLLGEKLLVAKREVKAAKLKWEEWRDRHCLHPKTSKALPSSTATLYQRIFEHREKLEESGIASVRGANEFLRRLKPAKENPQQVMDVEPPASSPLDYTPLPEPKPVWFKVGDKWTEGQAIATNQRGMVRLVWGENRESDIPNEQVKWSKPLELLTVTDVLVYEMEQELAAVGIAEQPSITPAASTLSYTPVVSPPVTCHLCKHRTLIDGVKPDRYWCEMGEFDDTLKLNYDWAKEGNEGHCKSFSAASHPLYDRALKYEQEAQLDPPTPTVRLKVRRNKGGIEVMGAIVQIGGSTHYLQPEDLQLEEL